MRKIKRKEIKTNEKKFHKGLSSKSERGKLVKKIKQKENLEKQDEVNKIKKKLENKKNKKFKNQLKNNKVIYEEKYGEISRRKRMKIWIIVVILISILFIARIGWIQFGMGNWLKEMALEQQSLDRMINPRRGTIYDSSGKNILAVSSTVNTITINPVNISKENKEKVAEALSNIFDLEYDDILKKVNKKTSIETIARKVEKSKADELRKWMEDNKIDTGINIDEDTKRFYPYNSLASQVIGFCGYDNQGLDGIEAIYEEELKGEKGRITKVTDAQGGEIENEEENYISATDGNDLILSIDLTIQGIAEKYLKEACIDNKCTDGGNIIIMNPKTGDILAMARVSKLQFK